MHRDPILSVAEKNQSGALIFINDLPGVILLFTNKDFK